MFLKEIIPIKGFSIDRNERLRSRNRICGPFFFLSPSFGSFVLVDVSDGVVVVVDAVVVVVAFVGCW